jgi:hypothetical protein
MVDRRAIRLVGREVRVRIHDLVAALLAIANDTGYTAKDTFTLITGALLVMAVQNLGIWREATGRELWRTWSVMGLGLAERREDEMR